MELAVQILEQIELPAICTNWKAGFQFIVYHFKPEERFSNRIRTFQYIHLFRQCYIGVLKLLDDLPEYDQSPTVAFLHRKVLSFLTDLPALFVSQVSRLGPNGILDTRKKNCQNFLEAKWSHLYHSAINLHDKNYKLQNVKV